MFRLYLKASSKPVRRSFSKGFLNHLDWLHSTPKSSTFALNFPRMSRSPHPVFCGKSSSKPPQEPHYSCKLTLLFTTKSGQRSELERGSTEHFLEVFIWSKEGLQCFCGMLINVTDWFLSPVPKLSAKFRGILDQQNVFSLIVTFTSCFFFFFFERVFRFHFSHPGKVKTGILQTRKPNLCRILTNVTYACCFWKVFQLVYFTLISMYRTRLVLQTRPVCWAVVKVTAFL